MLGNVGAAISKYNMHEETDKKDMVCMDIPLLIRVLEFTREDMKTDIELHNMVERLINMRDNVPLDMSHYDGITQKLVKENHIAIAMGNMLDDEGSMVLSQLEQLERSISMIRSYVGKDYEKQLPAWVQAKVTLASDYIDTVGNYLVNKDEKVTEETESIEEGVYTDDESIAKNLIKKYGKNVDSHQIRLAHHFHPEKHKTTPERIAGHVKRLLSGGKPVTEAKMPKPTALDKFRKAAAERAKKHDELAKNSGGMTSAIDRLQKHLNKEENELTEMDQKFIDSLNKLSQTHKVGDSVTVNSKFFGKQKGKVTKIDKQSVHVVRDGKKSAEKYPHDAVVKEDVYQDPQAATQTVFDGGNNTDDTSSNRKREMSKSARMIKALYKKHKMVKEDMYDHEKEDKSVQTYGKKPKTLKTDETSNMGENKPNAAAIVFGGTTLTGEKRDDVEIDPMMKNRPAGQNQFNKEFGKKGS
jgi:hypothetical protein